MTQYTPTVWQDGDAITAEKLNKIENRLEEINELPDIITLPSINYTGEVDLTYQEAKDYIDRGVVIPIRYKSMMDEVDYFYDYIFRYGYDEQYNDYFCNVLFNSNTIGFYASATTAKLQVGNSGGENGGLPGGGGMDAS